MGGLINRFLPVWCPISHSIWPLLFPHQLSGGSGTRLSIRRQDPNIYSDTEMRALSRQTFQWTCLWLGPGRRWWTTQWLTWVSDLTSLSVFLNVKFSTRWTSNIFRLITPAFATGFLKLTTLKNSDILYCCQLFLPVVQHLSALWTPSLASPSGCHAFHGWDNPAVIELIGWTLWSFRSCLGSRQNMCRKWGKESTCHPWKFLPWHLQDQSWHQHRASLPSWS